MSCNHFNIPFHSHVFSNVLSCVAIISLSCHSSCSGSSVHNYSSNGGSVIFSPSSVLDLSSSCMTAQCVGEANDNFSTNHRCVWLVALLTLHQVQGLGFYHCKHHRTHLRRYLYKTKTSQFLTLCHTFFDS